MVVILLAGSALIEFSGMMVHHEDDNMKGPWDQPKGVCTALCRPVHPSFGWVIPVVDWQKYHWCMGKKLRRNKVLKKYRFVSDDLKIGVKGCF